MICLLQGNWPYQTGRPAHSLPEKEAARMKATDMSGPGGLRRQHVVLGTVLAALGAGMAVTSLMGPLVFGFMQYRTSETTLNQLVGSDAAALFVAFPASVLAAVLVLRGHAAGPLLGSGIGVYAIYTYAQVVIGQEYLRLPGNIEYWFPLLLAVFVLAEAAVVLSLAGGAGQEPAPALSQGAEADRHIVAGAGGVPGAGPTPAAAHDCMVEPRGVD
jgi:hypothetical protein